MQFLIRTGLGRSLHTVSSTNADDSKGNKNQRGVRFGFGSLAIRYRREVTCLYVHVRVTSKGSFSLSARRTVHFHATTGKAVNQNKHRNVCFLPALLKNK